LGGTAVAEGAGQHGARIRGVDATAPYSYCVIK
jgi:hypothetical protein